jgi:hypothetical protein
VLCSNLSHSRKRPPGLLALPVLNSQQTMAPDWCRCHLQYQILISVFQPVSQCSCCLQEFLMAGATVLFTAPQWEVWQLSAGITPFVMASMLSLPVLVSASPRSQPFPPLSLARCAVAQTSGSTRARRVATSTSSSWARHHSPPPICSISYRVGPPRVLPPRQADPLCCLPGTSRNARGLPSLFFKTYGGLHADALAFQACYRGSRGLLNQAIMHRKM